MDTALAICAGIGLAAACGFRVFVPLLVASLAARSGYLSPSANLVWIGSTAALIIFMAATVAEIAAYYIPWVDNILDTVASPAAVIAGTLAAAAAFGNIDPAYKWVLALIAGGGAAALIQGSSVATRAISSAGTGGLGNFAVSTGEAVGAVVLAVIAILLPILGLVLAVGICVLLVRFLLRLRVRRARSPIAPA